MRPRRMWRCRVITVVVEQPEGALPHAGARVAGAVGPVLCGPEVQELATAVAQLGADDRLAMTAAYEDVLAAMTAADEADEAMQRTLSALTQGLQQAGERQVRRQMAALSPLGVAQNTAPEGSIALRKLTGSGQAFMYYNFNEVTAFTPGTEYAFLNGVYGPEQALTQLGSGAILRAYDDTATAAAITSASGTAMTRTSGVRAGGDAGRGL